MLPTAGRRLLSATIPTKRRHSDASSVAYEPATWAGFAGVGIVGRGARERSKPPPLVVGEVKPWLRGARAYQPKDQLLIEMEAMRAALQTNQKNQKKHPFVRGFLTDLFAINVAIADARDTQAVVFHVAPRVCAHRSYLLRLLFLLCEGVSTSQWESLLLSLETPVAKPASHARTRSQARAETAAQTSRLGRRSSHRTGEETPATTDTQSSPEREAAVINFKEDDELEEQEEHYRALLVMALRWQASTTSARRPSSRRQQSGRRTMWMVPSVAPWTPAGGPVGPPTVGAVLILKVRVLLIRVRQGRCSKSVAYNGTTVRLSWVRSLPAVGTCICSWANSADPLLSPVLLVLICARA